MHVFARFKEVRSELEGGLIAIFPDERTVETTFARRPDQSFSFTLDKVLPPRAPVSELQSQCAEPAAQHLASGQHAIIYAYGHGGSGKAATIFGSRDGSEQGMLLSVIGILCKQGLGPFAVNAVDIYKETLRDLLAPKPSNATSLKLRDSAAGSSVEGATELVIGEPSELASRLPSLQTLARGHCVVTVRTPTGAKLFAVELADSDMGGTGRQASADAETIEARKWSLKSFTALGNCLKAVADRAKVMPVRESILTRLQREALSASAHISLIGHCSVGDNLQEESVNTLRFVHRFRSQHSQQQSTLSVSRTRQSALDSSIDSSGSGGHSARDLGSRERSGEREKDRDNHCQPSSRDTTSPASSFSSSSSSSTPMAVKPTSAKAAQRKAALEAAVGVGLGGLESSSSEGGGGSLTSSVQQELARAWEYSYQLENLVVWMAEVFQVGGYDPAKLEGLLGSCCDTLNTTGGGTPLSIVQQLLAMHTHDVLPLPGLFPCVCVCAGVCVCVCTCARAYLCAGSCACLCVCAYVACVWNTVLKYLLKIRWCCQCLGLQVCACACACACECTCA